LLYSVGCIARDNKISFTPDVFSAQILVHSSHFSLHGKQKLKTRIPKEPRVGTNIYVLQEKKTVCEVAILEY
jgi:hypothetical protein